MAAFPVTRPHDTPLFDVWERVRPLFQRRTQRPPEIAVVGLRGTQRTACLRYFLRESTQLSSTYRLRETGEYVVFETISVSLLAFALNEHAEDLSAAFSLNMPGLPALALFFDAKDAFSVAYEPGRDWNALMVVAFFEMLRQIHLIAPNVHIQAMPHVFSERECRLLDATLHSYFRERWQAR